MDIPQILQFVDETVYAKTEKHLNDLQRRIIAGILKRQKYADVAETNGYSTKHVKKASYELWQMLSEVFDERVKKSNLESVLERQINQHITNFGNKNTQKIIGISYVSSCPASSTATPDEIQSVTPEQQPCSNSQTKIETIDKLRQFGLSDEQIADALGLPVDAVDRVDLQE